MRAVVTVIAPVFLKTHLPPAVPPPGDRPTGRGHGTVDGVIMEQLAEQVTPDWLGDVFRLLRERSEQKRMHMPGGDYGRLYWWSRARGGEDGIEDPVRNKEVRLSQRF